ncbi:hypothetical protein C5167_009260 [Papaver somniferum]|uniref:Uncharacterized protein n=1 Tax=Papaver somniferum TaxID=3469 RepID=A0A4Y7JZT2_PAPSO|nr:hypothetical protein C5167_009260 [Papaver somniferum]
MINGSEQSIGHCDLPEENKMEYQHNYVDGNTAKSFENAKSESRRMTAQNHYGNPANQNQVFTQIGHGKGIYLINWDIVAAPKHKGGLNIRKYGEVSVYGSWRRIPEGLDIVKKHHCWKLTNSEKVHIWTDIWAPDIGCFMGARGETSTIINFEQGKAVAAMEAINWAKAKEVLNLRL